MLFTHAPGRATTAVSLEYRTLITGAGAGIGRAFAVALAGRGIPLVLVDRDAAALAGTVDLLPAASQTPVETIVADLADRQSPGDILRHCRQQRLRIHTLINNAGIGGQVRFHRHSRRHIRQLITVNINAVVELTRLFLPAMLRRGDGAIVNVASICAFDAMPKSAVYGATKAFVLNFTESLQRELEGSGIYVTAICPGVTRTAFLEAEGYAPEDIPPFAQSAEEVVEESLSAMDRRQPLIVTGRRNRIRVAAQRITLRSFGRGAMRVARLLKLR